MGSLGKGRVDANVAAKVCVAPPKVQYALAEFVDVHVSDKQLYRLLRSINLSMTDELTFK